MAVFLRTGKFPVRAAITDGDWLVVFENPQDAFADGGACEPRYIHVFINAAEIDDRYEVVFGFSTNARFHESPKKFFLEPFVVLSIRSVS
jgi:hypothetical protein